MTENGNNGRAAAKTHPHVEANYQIKSLADGSFGRALADAESAAHAPTTVMCSHLRRGWGFCGAASKQSRPYSQALADIVSRYDLPALWAG